MGHARIRAAHGWGEEDEREEAMITSVEIKNFKSIKSLTIDLPKFAVLVGPNGSGKTNIVQAMELFSEILQRGTTDPARERGWEQIVRRASRPARTITLGARTRWQPPDDSWAIPSTTLMESGQVTLSGRLTLAVQGQSPDIPHVAAEEIVLESAAGRLRVATGPAGWVIETGKDPMLWAAFGLRNSIVSSGSADSAETALREMFDVGRSEQEKGDLTILRVLNRMRFPGEWLRFFKDSASVTRFRLDASSLRSDSYSREPTAWVLGPSGEGLPAAVDRLRGTGKNPGPAFRRVLEALKSVYPRIEDIRPARIQPGRLALLFKERGIQDLLGQTNVSDGVLHALALLVVLEGKGSADDGILAIEEPENAVHPWSVRAMMERAQASDRQVIITTHSETVVNAVKDPASLLIVENDDKKGTIVAKARDRETALDTILTETGQKLGDVWMDGSLGGVPGR